MRVICEVYNSGQRLNVKLRDALCGASSFVVEKWQYCKIFQ